MNFFSRKTVHYAIIILVGLLIYMRTLDVPFVLDDTGNLVESQIIKDLVHFFDPAQYSRYFGGSTSRYFGYLTFALNYRLHGYDVTGYHLVNISIHLITALLVYRLVSLTFRACRLSVPEDHAASGREAFVALLAALLFVTHPIQTQAVTYVVQRFASLAALFYLLSFTSYLQARLICRWHEGNSRAVVGWFTIAILSAVLAITTKQNAYTLPFAIIAFELLFFNDWLNQKNKKVLYGVLGFLIVAGAGITVWMRSSELSFWKIMYKLDEASRLQTGMSRWDYLATQCRVLITYLRILILPLGQHVDYDYPVSRSFLEPQVLVSALLLCALLCCALYCLYRARSLGRISGKNADPAMFKMIAFGIFWFFITHAIESSFIPIVDVIFEHRMYLPSVGIFMAVAATISLSGGEGAVIPGWPRLPVLIAVAAMILMLAGATAARNQVWRSEISLWEDNVRKSPFKARGHLNLGVAYADKGRFDEALTQFMMALDIDPAMIEAYLNIGMIREKNGDFEEALKAYRKCLETKPRMPAPYSHIGNIYFQQKRYLDALQEFDIAIDCDPDFERGYFGRGRVLAAMGRKDEAVRDFRRALQINPSFTEAAEQLRRLER